MSKVQTQETSVDESNIKDEVGSNCSYSKSEINADIQKDEEIKEEVVDIVKSQENLLP